MKTASIEITYMRDVDFWADRHPMVLQCTLVDLRQWFAGKSLLSAGRVRPKLSQLQGNQWGTIWPTSSTQTSISSILATNFSFDFGSVQLALTAAVSGLQAEFIATLTPSNGTRCGLPATGLDAEALALAVAPRPLLLANLGPFQVFG